MPALNTKPPRTDRLDARISPADKALLERAATLEGSSLASFVVSHARNAAAQVIRQHQTIHLTPGESEAFIKALNSETAPPTPRMVSALKLYRETVSER